MNNKAKQDSYLGIALLLLIGIGILLYPAASNLWNEYRNNTLATQYTKAVEQLPDEKQVALYEEAVAYNQQHTVNNIVYDSQKDPLAHEAYEQVLHTDNEVMGTITIPKLKQKLVIYHHLEEQALEQGCGHLEGTSLPVGGASSHGAYAAHRGLPTAKLFSDLDQLELGDCFYFYVLGHHLAYQVDQIKVVSPGDAQYLQIEAGKDLATLVTCTPYGVNTHRLLVRGERIPYNNQQLTDEVKQVEADFTYEIVLAGVVVAGIVLLFIVLFGRQNNQNNQRK